MLSLKFQYIILHDNAPPENYSSNLFNTNLLIEIDINEELGMK